MKVIKYLDPFVDVIGIGPDTSPCIISSVEVALVAFPNSYIFSQSFPTRQPRHTPSKDLMRGKPSTNVNFVTEGQSSTMRKNVIVWKTLVNGQNVTRGQPLASGKNVTRGKPLATA